MRQSLVSSIYVSKMDVGLYPLWVEFSVQARLKDTLEQLDGAIIFELDEDTNALTEVVTYHNKSEAIMSKYNIDIDDRIKINVALLKAYERALMANKLED